MLYVNRPDAVSYKSFVYSLLGSVASLKPSRYPSGRRKVRKENW
jgi:hypothetical protein